MLRNLYFHAHPYHYVVKALCDESDAFANELKRIHFDEDGRALIDEMASKIQALLIEAFEDEHSHPYKVNAEETHAEAIKKKIENLKAAIKTEVNNNQLLTASIQIESVMRLLDMLTMEHREYVHQVHALKSTLHDKEKIMDKATRRAARELLNYVEIFNFKYATPVDEVSVTNLVTAVNNALIKSGDPQSSEALTFAIQNLPTPGKRTRPIVAAIIGSAIILAGLLGIAVAVAGLVMSGGLSVILSAGMIAVSCAMIGIGATIIAKRHGIDNMFDPDGKTDNEERTQALTIMSIKATMFSRSNLPKYTENTVDSATPAP